MDQWLLLVLAPLLRGGPSSSPFVGTVSLFLLIQKVKIQLKHFGSDVYNYIIIFKLYKILHEEKTDHQKTKTNNNKT